MQGKGVDAKNAFTNDIPMPVAWRAPGFHPSNAHDGAGTVRMMASTNFPH